VLHPRQGSMFWELRWFSYLDAGYLCWTCAVFLGPLLNPLLRKGRTTPRVGLHFIRWVCGNSYWGAVGLSGGIGTSFHSGSPRVRPLLTQQLNLRAFDLLWVSLLHLGVLIHLLKRPCIFPVKPELYPFAFFSHICYDLEFKYLWFLKVTYVDRYPTNMYEVSD